MNFALIGVGLVARTHVAALRDLQGKARLVGVLSRDAGRARRFVEENCSDLDEVVRVYTDVSEIAGDDRIDVVAVCTPPNSRAGIVEELAAAGKHILMEKPIERTYSAARDIVEICAAHRVRLGMFLQHRMRASAGEMRKVLEAETLGKIGLIEISVPWWRTQAYYDEPGRGTYQRDGGGVLISQAIHTLDLALHLFGPVEQVQAMARTTALHDMESEDFVTAGLEFRNGAIGSLVASTASFPGGAESIVAHGTEGSARLESGRLDVRMRDGQSRVFGEEVATGGGADPMAFTHSWHQGIYEDFLSALGEDRDPIASGRDALNVHALIEALIQSSRDGRSVSVPSPGIT